MHKSFFLCLWSIYTALILECHFLFSSKLYDIFKFLVCPLHCAKYWSHEDENNGPFSMSLTVLLEKNHLIFFFFVYMHNYNEKCVYSVLGDTEWSLWENQGKLIERGAF